jgi:hypothetical protein
MYAAEGSSRSEDKYGSVEFSFNINETHLSNRVQDLLKKVFNLKSSVRVIEENNCRIVVCCSKNLARFFIDNFGKLASNKTIPTWLYNASNEEKMEFIKAYSEGDGCLKTHKGKTYYRMISSSEKMLIDIQSLCFSMGMFAHLSQSRKPGFCIFNRKGIEKEYPMKGLWELQLPFTPSLNKEYREDDNFFYVTISKIEKIEYNGDVINFETEGKKDSNHTFLVNNIISHNCDGAIWHEREDFQQRDLNRDQKLANVGWRVLRFKEDAINENMNAVKDTITKHIADAAKSMKKAEENGNIIKTASSQDGSENELYEFCLNNGQIGCYRENTSIGQILYFGNIENE